MSAVSVSNIPAELRERPQWVCWRQEQRGGKPTKVPVDAHNGELASSTGPASWSTFEDARGAVSRLSCNGVGFVFSEADPYAGVDLDDGMGADGTLAPAAQEIVETLDTYTEISPSGRGLHCILLGKVPPGARKQAMIDGQKIEVYSEGRFFCMTGASITNGTPVADAQAQLETLCQRLKAAARARGNGGPKLGEGEGRNSELTRRLGREVAKGVTGVALKERAHALNDFEPPLPDDEVDKILRSAEQWPTGDGLFLGHHRTDSGNAQRLIDHCGARVRYCASDSAWYVYNGLRWAPDTTLHVEDLAGQALRGIYDEAAAAADPEVRGKLGKWAVLSEAVARRRAAVEIARSDRRVAVRPSDFTGTAGCSTA